MTVISFGNLRFDFAFRSGGYDVHLPKDVLQDLLIGIVHCRNFLGIILILIRFNSVNRKNLLPYSTTSAHFKYIIGYCVLFSLQLGIIICVDFLYDRLHCHSRSAVLARKEYPKHSAE